MTTDIPGAADDEDTIHGPTILSASSGLRMAIRILGSLEDSADFLMRRTGRLCTIQQPSEALMARYLSILALMVALGAGAGAQRPIAPDPAGQNSPSFPDGPSSFGTASENRFAWFQSRDSGSPGRLPFSRTATCWSPRWAAFCESSATARWTLNRSPVFRMLMRASGAGG